MKKISCFLLLFVIGGVGNMLAQEIPAFPGAEGFGKYAQGGRGGEVIKVTNLEDSGQGSLRYALEAEGPRIIIFEVGGLIDLETPVVIENPYITIAGQSAPGDGIAIRGNGIRIATNNVIIRFLRIRPGDQSFGPENEWGHLDAITIGGADDEKDVFNVIIDHCSLSWATDEVFSVGSGIRNVTIQNSIISEGLNESKHPEGHHSKGILIRSKADSVSILNNLMVSNDRRNPKLNTDGLVDIRNNVIYNPGKYGATLVNTKRKAQKVNLVNNLFIRGPDTKFGHEISIYKPEHYNGKIYLENNSGFDEGKQRDNWNMLDSKSTRESLESNLFDSFMSNNEFFSYGAESKEKNKILDFLKNYVGASLPVRDKVDERVVKEFEKREGKIIDSQDQVGGWPPYLNKLSALDDLGDGIPEEWLDEYGLQTGEEHGDLDNDGYTNIEEYLNGTDPTDSNNRKEDIFRSSSISTLQNFDFDISQNFPNPFRSETFIHFEAPTGNTEIKIYDSIGRKVKTLLNRNLSSGEYELNWKPDEELSSGTFFLRFTHEGNSKTIPMTYIK